MRHSKSDSDYYCYPTVGLCGVKEGGVIFSAIHHAVRWQWPIDGSSRDSLCRRLALKAFEHCALRLEELGTSVYEVGDLVLKILSGIKIGNVGAKLCFVDGDGSATGQSLEQVLRAKARHNGA